MEKNQYIPRRARDAVRAVSASNPIVGVVGPRQSGKTTLVRKLFPHKPYANLEDLQTRSFALDDPRGFLAQFPEGAVIDEVQRAPDLLSQIQVSVDENPSPGRFILSGSAQLDFRAGIAQTLAGRIAFVRLLPFAYGELQDVGRAPASLEQAIFGGGYPPIHDRGVNARQWCADYISTYVERDVRQLLAVTSQRTFQRFLALCAGNVGQLLNVSRLGADAGISGATATAWLGVLETTFIARVLPPHHRNFRKRVVKTPKLYFHDTGVVAALLGIERAEQLRTHPLRGPLFENWVVSELLKGRFNRGLRDNLFFWRDNKGEEVDVIAEQGEMLLPIEIKSGATIASDWTETLNRFASFAGDAAQPGIVVHGGDSSQARGPVRLVPWTAIDSLASEI